MVYIVLALIAGSALGALLVLVVRTFFTPAELYPDMPEDAVERAAHSDRAWDRE